MSIVAARLSRRLSALVEVRTDGQLLAAFRDDRDEAAFAELVRRHGPLVWGACRRLLPDPADAEDAFQASFLVLVRRAHRLTGHSAVGPWLYRVAAWTARNARRRNARGLARRRPLSLTTAAPSAGPATIDLRADLDAALLSLPEKYRTALVLCHLQGWTRRDAAALLGCPEGTLSSLLSRGLDRLRGLLRSHDPARLLAAGGLGMPAVLAANTVRAAVDGKVVAAAGASSAVSQLVEGVLHMFWVKKATAAAAALCVVFGAGIGVGVSVRPVPGIAGDGDGPPASRVYDVAGLATRLDAPTAADLDALKAELAAAEDALKAAEDGLRLTRDKLKLAEAAAKAGTITDNELLQDKITLTRFEENAANARQKRAGVLARLKAAENPPAKRGLFDPVAQPAPPAQVDLDLLKIDLEAAEEALKAAQDGVRLATEKVELIRKNFDRGSVSKAELLDSEIALTRFKATAADAQQKRQAAAARLRAIDELRKKDPAAAKPAAQKAGDSADDLYRREIDAQQLIEPTRARVQQLQEWLDNSESVKEQVKRDLEVARKNAEDAQAQLQNIRKQRAALGQKAAYPPAANPAAVTGNFLFHLTVGAKGAPYQVKEYSPEGPAIGTVTFDNRAVLARYLARVGKTTPAGTGVRIFVPKDAPWDELQGVFDAVKASGLAAIQLTPTDPAKPGATATNFEQELLKQFGAKWTPDVSDPRTREAFQNWLKTYPQSADPAVLKRYRDAADALSKQAAPDGRSDIEAAKLRAEIEELTKRLRDLQDKPADPRSGGQQPAKPNAPKQ